MVAIADIGGVQELGNADTNGSIVMHVEMCWKTIVVCTSSVDVAGGSFEVAADVATRSRREHVVR